MAEGAVFDAQAVTDAVAEGIAKIENASTMEELKAIKTQYAGAESAMTQASKAIGALPSVKPLASMSQKLGSEQLDCAVNGE